jgi:hypothetical protein
VRHNVFEVIEQTGFFAYFEEPTVNGGKFLANTEDTALHHIHARTVF